LKIGKEGKYSQNSDGRGLDVKESNHGELALGSRDHQKEFER
jgi:hypothetical protein